MIGLIVARSKNNVIGKEGRIPWRIKGEQKQFKELTTGNVVVMGRKSYEEIGRPLPNRMNIVVSSTKEFTGENLLTVKSLKEALEAAGDRDVFISGGYGLFKEAMPIVDAMYVTEVDLEIEGGDTFFPEFDKEEFDLMIGETAGADVKFTRTTYVRKTSTYVRRLEEARALFSKDLYATKLSGIRIDRFGENYAKCSMPLTADHRNAYGGIMGGCIYTLADFAFAVASNFEKENLSVSLVGQATFLNMSKGSILYAEAKLIKDGRTNCFYEVMITDNLGKEIAVVSFTGAHVNKPWG